MIMSKTKSLTINLVLNCVKTVMNIIFPLITFPYISRVLEPSGIGKINFGSSVISYFVLLGSLGVVTYGIREGSAVKNNELQRKKFFDELFTANFFSTIASLILLLILLFVVSAFGPYRKLILIQSITILCNWIGVEWVFNIYEDYLQITVRTLITQIISIILMFIFVKNSQDYYAYVWITVIATGGTSIVNYFSTKRYYRPQLCRRKSVIKHLKSMSVFAVNLLAITIYVNSDNMMIGLFLDDAAVGVYSTGVKVYTIIKNLMSAVIVSISPRVSMYFLSDKKEEYHNLVQKVKRMMFLFLGPVTVGLFIMSPEIVYILAGNKYMKSVIILRILSVVLLFSSLGMYFSTFDLIVRRLEKKVLYITSISACINIGLNLFAIPAWGIVGAAITTLISEVFVFIMFVYLSNLKLIDKGTYKTVVTAFINCTLTAGICLLVKNIISNIYLEMVLGIAFVILVVLLICFLRNETDVLKIK